VFYLFFESFPLVFGDIYHFNAGQQGLAFMGYFVTGGAAYAGYCAYQVYVINPLYDGDKEPEAEVRLDLALYVSILIPISTFFFGWVSRPEVHWIVPIIAASLYLPG
jgi:DHA1 family multidrug resistance protein-like MFS transporter